MNYYQRLAKSQTEAVLAALPATYAEIIEKTGMTAMMVKHRTRLMRDENICYIGKWKRSDGRGKHSPVLFAGAGHDRPCTLRKLTDKDYSLAYRIRNKDTEKGDIRRAKDRMRHWKRKAKLGDPLVNALFGRGA